MYVGFRFSGVLPPGSYRLAHGVVITMGILSLFHIEIDLTIVASLMSVIGYSLNDNIVVSTVSVKTSVKIRRGTPYEDLQRVVDPDAASYLDHLGTTLVVILMLYLFGGPVLEGFSLTMLIGVSIGTASSIYVASALALKLGMKRERYAAAEVEKKGGSAVNSAVNPARSDKAIPVARPGFFNTARPNFATLHSWRLMRWRFPMPAIVLFCRRPAHRLAR